MKVEKFIKKLEEIKIKYGGELEVVMADNIPVVDPVFSDKYFGKKVIITDQNKLAFPESFK